MKPISLTVQGLHSFREKQTVDFDSLCQGGVFGIFGPTGSGKSSLLDAMTLALYGKVERATNNTQGIINHAEDSLSVSFQFRLGGEKSGKTYKIERTFKRTGDVNIRSATSRLIDLTSEPVVLADKTGEVNHGVENLLGLSIDDFTRAVVLPQGKFSEFLSLKGTERRQMLQRLFHLEKYGDELNKKLKDRIGKTKHEIELIEKEQLGLGDCSKEAVEEAEKQLQETISQIENVSGRIEKTQQKYEREKNIRKWMVEKAELETELKNHLQKQSDVEKLEKDMVFAKEAALLAPYIKELEESERSYKEWTLAIEKVTKRVFELKEIATKAVENLERAKREKNEEESPLQIKLNDLNRIKEELREIEEEEKRIEALNKELEELDKTLKEVNDKQEKAKQDLKKYEDGKQRLETDLANVQISSKWKNYVYEAYEAKQKIDYASQVMNEKKETVESIRKQVEAFIRQKEAGNEAIEKNKEALHKRFSQIYYWYDEFSNKLRDLEAFKKFLQGVKVEEEKKKFHELAIVLREELQENAPCLVCGSTEHDLNNIEHLHEESEKSGIEQQMEQVLRDIDEKERMLDKEKWTLEQQASSLSDFIGTFVEEKPNEEESTPSFSLKGENWLSEWEAFSMKLSKEIETVQKLYGNVQTEKHEMEKQREQLAGVERDLSSQEKRLKEESTHYEERSNEYEALLQKWKETYSDLAVAEVDATLQEVKRKEQQAETLRERIEKSTPHINDKKKEIEDYQESAQQYALKHSSLSAQIEEKRKWCTEKKEQVHESLKGEDVHNSIQKVKERLKQLNEAFEKAEKEATSAEQQLKEAEHEETVTKQSMIEAKQRLERAKEQWEAQVKKASLSSVDEAKMFVKTDEQIAAMEREIKAFEQKKQELEYEIKRKTEWLNGDDVSEEAFRQTENELTSFKKELDDLHSKKGGYESNVTEMKKRAERYAELEEQRAKLSEDHSKLVKLDGVFRGKAFVEFIAEEQLVQVSRLASERLHHLTRGRYAIEVDANGGFIIRDDANGGVKRPVSTLSGGETFLTSLALALSLSTSIQLKGEHPLEFFFLDEGFGTLDQELLETVISALEKLHSEQLSVGVISHVPELRERLPRKLIVTPSEPGGKGSCIHLEEM
ncbi:AAA family ATPase [Bacillus shivajii]|uniref:AAA family ATPase n=1 Tax=Bacillus shivajii TaxID=1983719 RepID=UPI001CFB7161|nr:AAA family ATPase [Bacillus shivajii]UCZ55124.1 AAA family ATPase [Bacillus shivajii]